MTHQVLKVKRLYFAFKAQVHTMAVLVDVYKNPFVYEFV